MLIRSKNHGFECIELNEFIRRFKKHSKECILNIYKAQRPIEAITESNRLVTTLPSDIFTIVTYDTVVMYEYQQTHSQVSTYTDLGCTLAIRLAHYIIVTLYRIHQRYRNNFYDSLERCCAAANDFLQMMTLLQDWIDDFIHVHQLNQVPNRPSFLSLQAKGQELVSVYLRDAVYSAQMAHSFVMDPMHTEVSKFLYSKEWEYPSGPYAVVVSSIIKTLQDYLQDVHIFLDSSYLLYKFLDALIIAMVTFLVQQLLVKAKKIRKSILSSKYAHRFQNPHRAANLFVEDVATIRTYFETLVPLAPGLESSIYRHFHPLESICIFINIITSWHPHTPLPEDELQKISHVLHRMAGKATAKLLRDLTLLFSTRRPTKISSKRPQRVYEYVMKNLEPIQVYENVEHYSYYSFMDDTQYLLPPVLRLDHFLALFYQGRVSGRCTV
jgi:hypothetical protein